MKSKITKIMGVVLTLAVLVGLLASAVPVSAGDLSWSNVTLPKVATGVSAQVFDVAADGQTIYLFDSTNMKKSTNGGQTWTTAATTGNFTNPTISPSMIAVNPNNPNYVIVSDGANLERSNNGGKTWPLTYDAGDMQFTAGDTINSIDIAERDGDIKILVAVSDGFGSGGVALFSDGLWTALTGGWAGADAIAAAFSPNYSFDETIVAVTAAGDVQFKVGGNNWGADVVDAAIGAVTSAFIAFPSDFDWASSSMNRVFIGTDVDVFKVNGRLSGTASPEYDLDYGSGVDSITYKGTAANGVLIVSDGNAIYRSENADTSNSPDWDNASNNPSGTTAFAKFSPADETLYVGTDAGFYTGAAPYNSFQGISLINVSGYTKADVTVSNYKGAGTDNQFMVLRDTVNGVPDDGNDVYLLFSSTDAGKNWKLIKNNGTTPINGVYITKDYATDQTIYLNQSNNRVVKSTDGGLTWTTSAAPGNQTIDAFALVDANTFWVGNSKGIQKSGSASAASIESNTAGRIVPAPGFFVVLTTTGEIYLSTDEGATFNQIGDDGQFVRDILAVDAANKTIYVQDSGNYNILKSVDGGAFTTAIKDADLPAAIQGGAITNLVVTADGAWYIAASGLGAAGELWRSVDIKDTNNSGFEMVPGSDAFVGVIAGGIVMSASAANPVLNVIVDDGGDNTKEPEYLIKSYTDTILNGPEIVAPLANAVVGGTVDFSWKAVSASNVKYDMQIAYDEGFTNPFKEWTKAASTELGSTLNSAVALTPGKTFYWRVRVSPGEPLTSKWSAPAKINVKLTGDVLTGLNEADRMYPSNGAVGVSTKPALTWGSVTGATSYEVKIASDAAFTTIVDEKTGITSTVYQPAKDLTPNTIYFWQVRAVNANGASDWVTSAFTTAMTPAPTGTTPTTQPAQTIVVPTPVVTVNPAPADTTPPATPAYVWIIIAIGAVLVVAVIVLIIRTRRV